jgi:hypothetical protein
MIANSYALSAAVHPTSPVGCLNRSFFSYIRSVEKVDKNWRAIKTRERLDEKARSLIFGDKKYTKMSRSEQKIVDDYQQKKLEEAPIILPNTGADLEQVELEQLLNRPKWRVLEARSSTSSRTVLHE